MDRYYKGIYSTLVKGITPDATSLTIATGEGVQFPPSNFYIAVGKELLFCTERIGDVFVVIREREGTIAKARPAKTKVKLRITPRIME